MDTNRRYRRRVRTRSRLRGSASRPRVSVQRTNRYCAVQFIDDDRGQTLLSLHGKDVAGKTKLEQAEALGKAAAEAAQKAGIAQAVLDRSGFRYHGRVKAIADGLRAGGLTL